MQCKQMAHVKGSDNNFHLGVFCVFSRNCFYTRKLHVNFVQVNVSYKLDTAMQDLQILTVYCFISLSLEEEKMVSLHYAQYCSKVIHSFSILPC